MLEIVHQQFVEQIPVNTVSKLLILYQSCLILSNISVYVPVSGNECVDLNFVLGAVAGTASTLVTARNWNVKITQYGCDSRRLAPAGCTQYFYGSTTGIIKLSILMEASIWQIKIKIFV